MSCLFFATHRGMLRAMKVLLVKILLLAFLFFILGFAHGDREDKGLSNGTRWELDATRYKAGFPLYFLTVVIIEETGPPEDASPLPPWWADWSSGVRVDVLLLLLAVATAIALSILAVLTVEKLIDTNLLPNFARKLRYCSYIGACIGALYGSYPAHHSDFWVSFIGWIIALALLASIAVGFSRARSIRIIILFSIVSAATFLWGWSLTKVFGMDCIIGDAPDPPWPQLGLLALPSLAIVAVSSIFISALRLKLQHEKNRKNNLS
jgi:hypothetical protein